jgi:uncharacterized protein (TIGR03435 family)
MIRGGWNRIFERWWACSRRSSRPTGLNGTFDFSLEWSLAPDSAQPLGSQPEDPGPTFLEALQQQLGLKLKSTKGRVDVLVIDHVEHPTAD